GCGFSHKGTSEWVHVICAVFQALQSELFREYVYFPQGDELLEVIIGCKLKWQFPRCAGAVGGSHISIIALNENHSNYFNGDGWQSEILQAVADHSDQHSFPYRWDKRGRPICRECGEVGQKIWPVATGTCSGGAPRVTRWAAVKRQPPATVGHVDGAKTHPRQSRRG
ncbi:hypothetical protein SKAU_G00140770, partial [Synaphobranchus kaupii]